MALDIATFDNRRAGAPGSGGSAFFKAVGHPLCFAAARAIIAKLAAARLAGTRHRVRVYDPQNTLTAFAALHPLPPNCFPDSDSVVYAQDVSRFDKTTLGMKTKPITDIGGEETDLLFVPVFDSAPLVGQIRRLLPENCEVLTLDEMRLPAKFLTDSRRYLNPLNFATNFLFFRDKKNLHTRLVTANYWSAYGADAPFVWGRLFDGDGAILADFEKPLGAPNETFYLDSGELRREFGLSDFCGQVFLHVARAAGHDIVKYVADSYGDADANGALTELSCTHDANSFPADLYAGIPAPGDGDSVLLWVQNSHPVEIPPHAVGVNIMGETGEGKTATYPLAIPPFATRAVNLGDLLPDARFPAQLEVRAGKHFVRPRYEVTTAAKCRRINHANVERTDLAIDERLPHLSHYLGKGYILPAPILSRRDYVSECLPTPMSTAQENLPLLAVAYDATGREIARRPLGCLPRNHRSLLNLSDLAAALPDGEAGHVELLYDFSAGGGGDGWMHALFRYTGLRGGHVAETSFGAHMFNHLLTYKNEPQSYKGPPPGLTTRLFLRIAPPPVRTFCHLIYPVGAEWHPHSDTHLQLKNRKGEDVAAHAAAIAAGGSLAFYCDEVFSADELQKAGAGAYVLIRDITCRLFGYHGARAGEAFAFDHMFGF